ncbi:MAG: acyl-CoA dehydrogenase [Burkholderiaceae bacterium]|nr:acyl-CoA dehydrogenase [Burkholderiaceae bacterium]
MNRTHLDFLLYDWLGVDALTQRARYADHARETFDAVLDMSERLAREKFAPFNRLADTEEPSFDGERVRLPQATADATRAYVESGLVAAGQDAEVGGMQLPYVIEMAANAWFYEASIAISGYAMLSTANANLLMAAGTPAQRRAFAQGIWDGRFMGTMCLSEPQAGSGLADITTRALPDGDGFEADPLGPRYRLRGNKMWISAGDHELSENIVHLVLAKIPDAKGALPAGVKGISLFIVPKHLLDERGQPSGERNDVALAGLNHKLGYRGTVNTLLNFGEGGHAVRGGPGAIGYRVGEPGDGLRHMFHMMNEARINVGLGAAMLGLAGFAASLEYARNRTQGRPLDALDAPGSSPQRAVPLVSHPDVRRMLIAQKAYAEGALALCLYTARLVDEKRTGAGAAANEAAQVLELLTPIVKSWPSEWCLEGNNLAIQVHGGYGYTRDFPVEQYWRDNRLNMIHEGTHGIQALDLLRRKVRADGGRALSLWRDRVRSTCEAAAADTGLAEHAAALSTSADRLGPVAESAWAAASNAEALANATAYLQAFGHTVIAWVLLDVALAATARLREPQAPADLLRGQIHSARYFFAHELPRAAVWLAPVEARERSFIDLQEAWL